MSELTLRERSKAKRHAAIERAAMELFAERGYDATTLAQVGEAAEVAARTVTMYFPSKLHLALSYTTAAAVRLEEALDSRGPGTPAVDVVLEWLRQEFEDNAESMALQAAMFRANPEIRGGETPELSAAKGAVTAALAADLGRKADDVIVGIAGGAFAGVIDVLIQVGPEHVGASGALDIASGMLAAVMEAAKPSTTATRR